MDEKPNVRVAVEMHFGKNNPPALRNAGRTTILPARLLLAALLLLCANPAVQGGFFGHHHRTAGRTTLPHGAAQVPNPLHPANAPSFGHNPCTTTPNTAACWGDEQLPVADQAACAGYICGADCIPEVTGCSWSGAKGNRCIPVDWSSKRSKTGFHELSIGDCAPAQPARADPTTWYKAVYGEIVGSTLANKHRAVMSKLAAPEPGGGGDEPKISKGIVRLTFHGKFGDRITQFAVARLVADALDFALGIDRTPVKMEYAFENAGNQGIPPRPEMLVGMNKQLLQGPFYGIHHVLANKQPRLIHIDGLGSSEMWFLEKHAAKLRHEFLVPSLAATYDQPALPKSSDVVVHLDAYPDCTHKSTQLPLAYYGAALDSMYKEEPWGNIWLVSRCGAEDKTVIDLMRKYNANIFAPPNDFPQHSYKLQVHDLLFMVGAQRIILAESMYSWWAGFLGNAQQVHVPLFSKTWGPKAINRMYVNEPRYVYHDLVSTPARHGLHFADIEHEEWVQSAHDRFCKLEYCKTNMAPHVDSLAKTQRKYAAAAAAAAAPKAPKATKATKSKARTDPPHAHFDGEGGAELSIAKDVHHALETFHKDDGAGKTCPVFNWPTPKLPYSRRASNFSAAFESSIAHVSDRNARTFMRTVGVGPHDGSKGRLAVVVPYRNREMDLNHFVPHMHRFLEAQGVDFTIVVVNQTDAHRFNRGELINIGFQMSKWSHEYFVMHDVDLFPVNPSIPYRFVPEPGKVHHLLGALHPNEKGYRYGGFVGGVLVVRMDDFERIDGFPNNFWGWGGEDDAFNTRLHQANIKIKTIDKLVCVDTGLNTWAHDTCEERDITKMDFRPSGRNAALHGLSTGKYEVEHIGLEEVVAAGGEGGSRLERYPYARVDVKLVCSDGDDHIQVCEAPIKCHVGEYAARSDEKLHKHDFQVKDVSKALCNKKMFKVHWTCKKCVTECAEAGAWPVGECSATSGPVCMKSFWPPFGST